jgi:hypothetical protein
MCLGLGQVLLCVCMYICQVLLCVLHVSMSGYAVCVACVSVAGNMVGPSVDWSQQVIPALAAVPKPGGPGADAAGADAAPAAADTDEVAWDAQGAQPDQDPRALTTITGKPVTLRGISGPAWLAP